MYRTYLDTHAIYADLSLGVTMETSIRKCVSLQDVSSEFSYDRSIQSDFGQWRMLPLPRCRGLS